MSESLENGEAKEVKHSDWDSALAGTPVVETTEEQPKEPEVEPAPEPEAAEEQAAEPEVEPAEPTPEAKKPVDVPLSALMAEREKAKEWKQKFEEAQKQSQSYEQTQPEYNQANYYDDPAQAIQSVKQDLTNQLVQMKASMSEQMARSTLPDYQDKINVFYKYAQQNPSYVEQVQASENPALMAYKLGKQWDFQEKYGTEPEQIRQKMMEEVKAELSKEKSTDTSRRAAAAAKQPTNVQSMRQAGGTAMPEFKKSSFSDVLGR